MKRALVIGVVGSFVAACLGLGIWQLDRLGERRALNERILARADLPVADIAELFEHDPDPDEVSYRRVAATGRYDTDREIILLSRAHRGLSGHHVLTPLATGDGRLLLVDRGWVPLASNEPPVADAAPPAGTVTVEGIVLPGQVRGRFGPRQIDDGPHTRVFRVDLAALSPQFPSELYPVYLQLERQDPPTVSEHPIAVAAPEPDQGPHLAYAIQWFLFATAAAVTAAAVARKRRV